MTKLGAFDSYVQDEQEKKALLLYADYQAKGGKLGFNDWWTDRQLLIEQEDHDAEIAEDDYNNNAFDRFNRRDKL